MQITEVTGLGVRSAAITLRRDGSPMAFMLFPMVHFAAPSFYAQVRRRLHGCTVIVAEGVSGPTLQSNAMDFANRYFPRGRQHGIVGQSDEAVLPEGIPVIRPDVSPAEPGLDLSNIPGLGRMAKWMAVDLAYVTTARAITLALALAGPRVLLDKDLEIHDFPFTHREEEIVDPINPEGLEERDAKLVDALIQVHEQRALQPITVGVVYGAMHMPVVSDELGKRYGYRPRKAEWMTVFAPD